MPKYLVDGDTYEFKTGQMSDIEDLSIDTAFDVNSTNPVQNKVITQAFIDAVEMLNEVDAKTPFVMTANLDTTTYALSNPDKTTQEVLDAFSYGKPVFCIASGSSGTYTKHEMIPLEYIMTHSTASNSYAIFAIQRGNKNYTYKFQNNAFASPNVTTFQTV